MSESQIRLGLLHIGNELVRLGVVSPDQISPMSVREVVALAKEHIDSDFKPLQYRTETEA